MASAMRRNDRNARCSIVAGSSTSIASDNGFAPGVAGRRLSSPSPRRTTAVTRASREARRNAVRAPSEKPTTRHDEMPSSSRSAAPSSGIASPEYASASCGLPDRPWPRMSTSTTRNPSSIRRSKMPERTQSTLLSPTKPWNMTTGVPSPSSSYTIAVPSWLVKCAIGRTLTGVTLRRLPCGDRRGLTSEVRGQIRSGSDPRARHRRRPTCDP